MRDLLLDLPILKGMDKENVWDVLKHTHIEFRYYSNGDIILNPDMEVNEVLYLIGGNVRKIWTHPTLDLSFSEKLLSPSLINGAYLFGFERKPPYSIISEGPSSLLTIPKQQFFSNICKEQIPLINYFNYLSLRAQRPVSAFMSGIHNPLSIITNLLMSISEPSATDMKIHCNLQTFSIITGTREDYLINVLTGLCDNGIISMRKNEIIILSKEHLLDYLANPSLFKQSFKNN